MAAKDQEGKDLAKRNFGKAMATLVEAGQGACCCPGRGTKAGCRGRGIHTRR